MHGCYFPDSNFRYSDIKAKNANANVLASPPPSPSKVNDNASVQTSATDHKPPFNLGASTKNPLPIPNSSTSFGNFIALLIGNDKYDHMKSLDTPVSDVNAIKAMLERKYGFRVIYPLLNATRQNILGALTELKDTTDENSNVLIYYAGHGHLDKAESRGYWLPVDAEDKNPDKWIANDDITSKVKAMAARHVLIIADSCYSGSMMRGDSSFRGSMRSESGELKSEGYLRKIWSKKSRQVLTSGGNEPVIDNGGKGKHSVFASVLLDTLLDSESPLDSILLFEQVRQKVGYNAEQTPEYGVIKNAGHDGGEFIFIPLREGFASPNH